MDLSVLKQVPYVMDAFAKWTQEAPKSIMLVDDQYYKGWTRQRVNEESARIYAYLKQQGITFVLLEMTSPGVDVLPLEMTSGEEIQNQVFFDEVRILHVDGPDRVQGRDASLGDHVHHAGAAAAVKKSGSVCHFCLRKHMVQSFKR